MKEKILAALAYVLFVPGLYIVLSDWRKKECVGYHGGQALLFWTAIFISFFFVRFLVNLVWLLIYIPYLDLLETLTAVAFYGYALKCAWRAYQGETFVIPLVERWL